MATRQKMNKAVDRKVFNNTANKVNIANLNRKYSKSGIRF